MNVVYDPNSKVPHGTVSGQTCFYDNKQSIADKVKKKQTNKTV
jgi:hypothetical protein